MHWLDPLSVPEYVGTIDRYLPNAHGQIDGLLLSDGREVCIPPHLSTEVLEVLRVGDPVKLRGVKPRAGDVIAAVSLETADGRRIIDNGPTQDHKAARPRGPAATMVVEGQIARLLHGPKGDVRGVLLIDGQVGRMPPHAVESLRSMLLPGGPIALRGEALVTEYGTVLVATEIGTSLDDLRRVDAKNPKGKPKKHKPHPDDRHPEDAETQHAF